MEIIIIYRENSLYATNSHTAYTHIIDCATTHDVVIQLPECTLFRRIISDGDMKIAPHELSHRNTFLSDETNAFCVRFIL